MSRGARGVVPRSALAAVVAVATTAPWLVAGTATAGAASDPTAAVAILAHHCHKIFVGPALEEAANIVVRGTTCPVATLVATASRGHFAQRGARAGYRSGDFRCRLTSTVRRRLHYRCTASNGRRIDFAIV